MFSNKDQQARVPGYALNLDLAVYMCGQFATANYRPNSGVIRVLPFGFRSSRSLTFRIPAPFWSLTCRLSYSQVSRRGNFHTRLMFSSLFTRNEHTFNLCLPEHQLPSPFFLGSLCRRWFLYVLIKLLKSAA